MITSVNNNTVKNLVKLKNKKYRDEVGYYLVEGEHLVEEALKANQAVQIITTKPFVSDLEVIEVTPEVMKKLAFTKTPQDIMAKCKINENKEIVEGTRFLMLDDLQDPGNIGTLLRTALAFEIDQVILSPKCVDLYNDKLLRAMQGAHFHLNIIYHDLLEAISKLQQQDVTIVGTALENGCDINLLEKTSKMAFIVGNEGNGMNRDVLARCDKIGYIKIKTIESLNVAIAGSIMMYHFR